MATARYRTLQQGMDSLFMKHIVQFGRKRGDIRAEKDAVLVKEIAVTAVSVHEFTVVYIL